MEHKDDDKEIELNLSDQVKEAMANDAELAEALREIFACMRQAMEGVQSGRYRSFDEGMERITGERPRPVDEPFDDEDEG